MLSFLHRWKCFSLGNSSAEHFSTLRQERDDICTAYQNFPCRVQVLHSNYLDGKTGLFLQTYSLSSFALFHRCRWKYLTTSSRQLRANYLSHYDTNAKITLHLVFVNVSPSTKTLFIIGQFLTSISVRLHEDFLEEILTKHECKKVIGFRVRSMDIPDCAVNVFTSMSRSSAVHHSSLSSSSLSLAPSLPVWSLSPSLSSASSSIPSKSMSESLPSTSPESSSESPKIALYS